MRQPWNAHIHLGIVHPMVFPETLRGEGPILETASKIVMDEFFGAIELSWIKDPQVRVKLGKLLEPTYLDVVFCGGPPILIQKLDMNSLDPAVRRAAVKGVKELVDEAYTVGAKILITCSGPSTAQEKRGQAKNLLVESLKEVCAYAEQKADTYTLFVTLENFDEKYDKKLLIGPTKEAVEIAETVRGEYKNFGLTVDLSHLPLLKETPEGALLTAKDYLEHVHIGNCVMTDKAHPLYGDQHPSFGVKGGENQVEDLVAFLRALKNIGYFGKKTATKLPVVSFEVKPSAGETSDIVIASSKRVFLDAWARL